MVATQISNAVFKCSLEMWFRKTLLTMKVAKVVGYQGFGEIKKVQFSNPRSKHFTH